jgi:uncharacterized protein
LQPFDPFFRNAHLATIAGNFWSRPESEVHWPIRPVEYTTEPEVRVLVHEQRPAEPLADLVLVHGLEGSSDSGYMRSMAHGALTRGIAAHRFNMRGCGGTEHLALTSYHAGQTSDLLHVLREIKRSSNRPLFLVGFSLGGNVALKLAGELGDSARGLLAAVAAVSTPIDLAACAAALERPANFIYENRFLGRLKARIERRHTQAPHIYTLEHLPHIRTIREFDDNYTGPLFGFGNAANYFRTQSSNQFLESIRVPTLVIHAEDDPMIPAEVYRIPAFSRNPALTLVTTMHGGHLGFLSRRNPRFWVDETVLGWVAGQMDQQGLRRS